MEKGYLECCLKEAKRIDGLSWGLNPMLPFLVAVREYKKLAYGKAKGEFWTETELKGEDDSGVAFGADITYTDADNVKFDHMDDERAGWDDGRVMRGLNGWIADEADFVLIDRATEPAIMSEYKGKELDGISIGYAKVADRLRKSQAVSVAKYLKMAEKKKADLTEHLFIISLAQPNNPLLKEYRKDARINAAYVEYAKEFEQQKRSKARMAGLLY